MCWHVTRLQPRIQLLSSLSQEAEERMAQLVDDGSGMPKRKKRSAMVVNDTVICEGAGCDGTRPASSTEMFATVDEHDVEDLDT